MQNTPTIGTEKMEKASKQCEAEIERELRAFRDARAWPDLRRGLLSLKNILARYRQYNISIPKQKNMAKRLSQCLKEDYKEIHELTMEVYDIIFDWELHMMNSEQTGKTSWWQKRDSSIALYFSGLFSVYQYSQFGVKKMFLDLVQFKMLRMKKELILSLPGFMLCMLPALEENLVLQNQIKEILQKTEEIVGTSEFFGQIWKAMLRTPRARLAAIRYLKARIPVSPLVGPRLSGADDDSSYDESDESSEVEQNLEMIQESSKSQVYPADYTIRIVNEEVVLAYDVEREDYEKELKEENEKHDLQAYLYFYFPNKSNLAMNALHAGLSVAEFEQVQVQRATLDFIISHMPIRSPINSIRENARLAESAIYLYNRRDFAVVDKIKTWLFEHIIEDDDSDDDDQIDECDPCIISIVQAIKNMLVTSMDIENQEAVDSQVVNNPMQVLMKIFNDERRSMENTLKHLAVPLMQFIKFHTINKNIELNRGFKQNLNHLLDQISWKFAAILRSLLRKLEEDIKNVEHTNDDQDCLHERLMESVDLIQFAICDLLTIGKHVLDEEDSQKCLGHIMSQLMLSMDIFSREDQGHSGGRSHQQNDQNLQIIISSLEVIEKILRHEIRFEIAITAESIENFNKLYVTLGEKLIGCCRTGAIQGDPKSYKLELETFKRYNNIMYQILKWQRIDDSLSERPEWLNMLINSSKAQYSALCLNSIKIFINILDDEDIDLRERAEAQGGGALTHIKRLICLSSNVKTKSRDHLQVLERPDPTFTRKEFLESLQVGMIHQESRFNEIVHDQQSGAQVLSGYAHCREIIMNLWTILDNEVDTDKIVERLKDFDRLLPRIFSAVVIKELQDKGNRERQNNAIKKFATFWRLTVQSYPLYKPFEAEIEDVKELVKLDAIARKTNSFVPYPDEHPLGHCTRKYMALHEILNFLEDPDPTLRLSCRSWLQQNYKHFDRILDPIIEEFMKYSNFHLDQQSQSITVHGEFKTSYVIQNFSKLRNIILNSQEVIEYIIMKDCQEDISNQYQNKLDVMEIEQLFISGKKVSEQPPSRRSSFHGSENDRSTLKLKQRGESAKGSRPSEGTRSARPSEANEALPEGERYQYLDVLVGLTLMFMRCQPSRSQLMHNEEKIHAEMLTVNASACEFLQLILRHVEKYQDLSNKLAHRILDKLIDTFYDVIQKRNLAMQDNILNLLDFILNKSNIKGTKTDREQESIQRCVKIFKESKLIRAIILGLKCDSSFVRLKFINFVEMYVPFLRQLTREIDKFQEILKEHIKQLMDCFLDLMKHVDVSSISTSQAKGQQMHHVSSANYGKISQREIKDDENDDRRAVIRKTQVLFDRDLSKNLQKRRQRGKSSKRGSQHPQEILKINQESDVVSIIGGLQCIIHKCLDLKTSTDGVIEQKNEEEILNQEEKQRIEKLEKERNANNQKGFLKQLFGGNNQPMIFQQDVVEDIKKLVLEGMGQIFISCIFCWNHSEFFSWSDYHFSRSGIFGFHDEDGKMIENQLRQDNLEQAVGFEKSYGVPQASLDQTMLQFINPIQRKVLQLLRPIAKLYPDQFVEGVIVVWIKKTTLGPGANIKSCYEKLIQILVCVSQARQRDLKSKIEFLLPVQQVIESLVQYIKTVNKDKTPDNTIVRTDKLLKNGKNAPALNHKQTLSESLLNSFLYTYLVYSASMYDPLLDKNMVATQFRKVYQAMFNYFNLFKLSRNPFTILWLLEILKIVSVKYDVKRTGFDKKMKKDYNDLLNQLLADCGEIITNSFNVEFSKEQRYQLAFAPTVYEFLWRYEYMQFKHKVVEKNANKHDSNGSLTFRESTKIEKKKYHLTLKNGSIFFNNEELKEMVAQKFEFLHKDVNSSIGFSIFKNMDLLMHDNDSLPGMYASQGEFMTAIKYAIRGDCSHKEIFAHSKLFTMVTLKQILSQLMVSLIRIDDEDRQQRSMQIILSSTVHSLQKHQQNSAPDDHEMAMNEFTLDFFASLVQMCRRIDPKLLQPHQKTVRDIFSQDSFFNLSMFNLRQWQRILRSMRTTQSLEDLSKNQLDRWNRDIGFFDNKNMFIAHRCNAIKRIAFLMFSCEVGRRESPHEKEIFAKVIKQIIFCLKAPFRKQGIDLQNDIKQMIFVFFLIRVILIKQDAHNQRMTLKMLWPHLLSMLVSIFEVKQDKFHEQDQQYADELTIEAIKLIELLSSLNLEDFQMNQWMFLVDGIGMRQGEPIYKERRERQGSTTSQMRRTPRLAGSGPSNAYYEDLNNSLSKDLPHFLSTEPTRPAQKRRTMSSSEPSTFKASTLKNGNHEPFNTLIIKYVGKKEFSFNNVEVPNDGRDERQLQRFWSKESEFQDTQTVRDLHKSEVHAGDISFGGHSGSQNEDRIERISTQMSQVSKTRGIEERRSSAAQARNFQAPESFEPLDQDAPTTTSRQVIQHARSLQISINNQQIASNAFDRRKAEFNVEIDFTNNNKILK